MLQLEVNVWSGVEIDDTPCKINGYVAKFPTQTPPDTTVPRNSIISWLMLFNTAKPLHFKKFEQVIEYKYKIDLVLIKCCLELNNEFVDDWL